MYSRIKILVAWVLLTASSALTAESALDAAKVPEKKISTLGLYLTAVDAHEMKKSMGEKALFVDLRTHGELYALGMATGVDANVQYELLTEKWSEKGNFKRRFNPDFLAAMDGLVAKKGMGKDDTIILICRSGKRSAKAASLMAKAGYTNIYHVVDGYEGDKAKEGPHKGQRIVNGWKNAGLPWSYTMREEQISF